MSPVQDTQRRWPILLALLTLANALPELFLQAADAGLLGSTRWRLAAYSHGALWAGLLQGWRPNFTGQATTMFLTYGFLHSGLLHLLGNIAGIACFGSASLERLGGRRFVLLYLICLLGGALAFVALSDSFRPMVGASGAVYGLAAAWIYWDMRARQERGETLSRTWINLALLLGANGLSWYLLAGELAWQTHLGGAFMGWVGCWYFDRQHPSPSAKTPS